MIASEAVKNTVDCEIESDIIIALVLDAFRIQVGLLESVLKSDTFRIDASVRHDRRAGFISANNLSNLAKIQRGKSKSDADWQKNSIRTCRTSVRHDGRGLANR